MTHEEKLNFVTIIFPNELVKIDSELHQEIMSFNKLLFAYHNALYVDDPFLSTYTVPEVCTVWGMQAVLARIVYAYFLTRDVGNRQLSIVEGLRKHDAVRSLTLQWLLRHGFPPEIQYPYTFPTTVRQAEP